MLIIVAFLKKQNIVIDTDTIENLAELKAMASVDRPWLVLENAAGN